MKPSVLSILRSIVAIAAGALTVLIVLFGTILLVVPGWMTEGGFPDTTPGLALLLGLEILAGLAGAFVAALLAPRAPRVHGWTLGALLLIVNVTGVAEPGSSWPLVPAVLLVGFVPVQTWVGIVLALRLRARRGRQMIGSTLLLGTLCLAAACTPPDSSGVSDVAAGVAAIPSTDGVPIVYEVHGGARADAPTLVLIHGWSCDRTYWGSQVGPLAERFRVVTLDLAGHGDSGFEREEWTIASYGADVAAVIEELDLEDVVLVGHSMGGDVAVDAARLVPERVAAMVWVDAYRQLGTPHTPEEIEAFVAPLRADFSTNTYAFVSENLFHAGTDSALVQRVARDMSEAPPEIAVPSIESSFANGAVVPVVLDEELDLPVVAINPDDGSTDVASMERYGVDVVFMPDVGHFLMMEDPESFNALLTEVVGGLGE